MIWLASIIGAAIGAIVTMIFHGGAFATGTLRIDRSNPEKDIYRIDINDLDSLNKKSRVVLKVDHNADLSQK